ncbi:MAG: PEP-CTERM sorting domain-containing protein [Verrucomicrobiota bacterium]
MKKHIASLAAVIGLFALSSHAYADSVTSWTKTAGGTTIAGLNSASPIFGDGTAGSGNGYQINAALPSVYTLATVGDSLAFSGSVTLDLGAAGAGSDQFRFGLFDTNGSGDVNGWLGYFATNSGSGGNPNGRLWERKIDNTAAYFNNGVTGADERQFSAGVPASTSTTSTFLSGTYDFSLALTRTADGLSVAWSIIGTDGTNYTISGVYADATALTYDFDRVGFMTGGGLNADQVTFSNVDLTYTSAIPEPASTAVLLASVAGLATLSSRRRRLRAAA